MRQRQNRHQAPFRRRDNIDEIDELEARYLEDKAKLIEEEFKANPDKLITPNQAS